MTWNLLSRFSQTLLQLSLEISTALDAQCDTAQICVATSPHIAVGAALEQHLSSGEEIINKFLSQFM